MILHIADIGPQLECVVAIINIGLWDELRGIGLWAQNPKVLYCTVLSQYNRLWAQNLIGHCTVRSCHNSLVPLHSQNCVPRETVPYTSWGMTDFHKKLIAEGLIRFCAQSLLCQKTRWAAKPLCCISLKHAWYMG